MDSVLRPRDIQARIRSGESPETVAAAAQTTVEKIIGFATPVLAERAYIAEQALKASVRRRAGDGAIGHLGEAVEQRLATRDVAADSVAWDAWRREDGRWTLVADYGAGAGGTRAEFVYDAAGRYVMADNDEARWLVGERSTAQPAPTEHVTPSDTTVVETVFEPEEARDEPISEPAAEQLPLGDDAIEVVTGLRPVPEPLASDDWMLTQASERATPRRRVVEEPAETLFDDPLPDEPAGAPAESPTAAQSSSEPSPESETVVETEQGQEPQPDQPAKPRKSGKSRRASVPSWDEIMFGSGKGE